MYLTSVNLKAHLRHWEAKVLALSVLLWKSQPLKTILHFHMVLAAALFMALHLL